MKFQRNTTFAIALIVIAKRAAKQMKVDMNHDVSKICEEAGVSREYSYELGNRIVMALNGLAGFDPEDVSGVAPSNRGKQDNHQLMNELKVRVLRYRADHPGAVVSHGKSSTRTYSPGFQRLILQMHDEAGDSGLTRAEFAQAVEVSTETLRHWLELDRQELDEKLTEETVRKSGLKIPLHANELNRNMMELYRAWEGSTRAFVPYAARKLGLSCNVVKRVLQIFNVIKPRRRKPPRHRGSTESLSPGSMLVCDGKEVNIELPGSGRRTKRTIHAFLDQTTGAITGSVATKDECALGYEGAMAISELTLGGQWPLGILHDNKPCLKDEKLIARLGQKTKLVAATLGRGQNKAVTEGTFSDFEVHVGSLSLDDSSRDTFVTSAVNEVFRAYSAGRNHSRCIHCGGDSRIKTLNDACPSQQQKNRDLKFIQNLKREHKQKFTHHDEHSRALLDDGFEHWGLLDKDPSGNLRRYLSYCEPEAVRRGFAIYAGKAERGVLRHKFAHRYLARLIESCQHEIDLEHAETELWRLAGLEGALHVSHEEAAYNELSEACQSALDRCCQVAEKALECELPVGGAFWRHKLKNEIETNPAMTKDVTKHIRRCFEASLNARIGLLDLVIQTQKGLTA